MGVFSLYEGIHKLQHPEELTNAIVPIVVLLIAIVLETFSLRTAMREIAKVRGDATLWQFIRHARSPELPVVALEDIAALTGLVFALLGVGLTVVTDDPVWDSIGTILIGLLLLVVAVILGMETKSMLVGESATPAQVRAIRAALEEGEDITRGHPHEDDAPRAGRAPGGGEDRCRRHRHCRRGGPGDRRRRGEGPRGGAHRPGDLPGARRAPPPPPGGRMSPALLETVVQHYSWGSRTLIPALLGLPAPADEPWAELWVGAHPKGPSRLPDGRSLAEVEPDLPFLLKILSAVEPLSLQAHPDAEQAAKGFAEEEAAGVPFDAPERTFKDPNAKPEIIIALTPFDALCGFRRPQDALRLVSDLDCRALDPLADALGALDEEEALRRAFTLEMLNLNVEGRGGAVVASAAGAAAMRAADPATDPEDSRVYGWLARLAVTHRGDASALAPLLLNVVHLEPGTAVFLPARHLHAYLAGAGIEVMGNSDNVLRGGLTPKHVDVPRLLDTVEFVPYDGPVIAPRRVGDGVDAYDVPVSEFAVHRVHSMGAPVTLALQGPLLRAHDCRCRRGLGLRGQGVAAARPRGVRRPERQPDHHRGRGHRLRRLPRAQRLRLGGAVAWPPSPW